MNATQHKPVILWGGMGHARVLNDCLGVQGYTVIAVFDQKEIPPPFGSVPTGKGEEDFIKWFDSWTGEQIWFAVAIGGALGADRLHRAQWLTGRGLHPFTVIHTAASVEPSAIIDEGAQILAGAIIGAGAHIGCQSIINSNASVDHDCRIGEGVHIAPGVTLCGEVDIANKAFVGAGATVLPRIRIGEGAVIGAGATVVRDVEAFQRVAGVPAKEMQSK